LASPSTTTSSPLLPVVADGATATTTTLLAQSNLNGGLSYPSSSYGLAEVLSSYYVAKDANYSLLNELLASLSSAMLGSAMVEDLLKQTPQQPFSPALPAAGSSSSSSGPSSSGYGGSSGLLAILALFSLLLLGGKGLRSMRELPRPSSVLIPIIERPG
jgi:hypothetical protein